jgi:hypothetical protein
MVLQHESQILTFEHCRRRVCADASGKGTEWGSKTAVPASNRRINSLRFTHPERRLIETSIGNVDGVVIGRF